MPTVKDIMTKNVISIGADKSVFEAAELMSSSKIGCLVITDGEAPIGIVTERDIVRRVVAKNIPVKTKISEIMSRSLITVDAARVMSSNKIRRLPVMKQNKLVGIVVASDFVRNVGKKTVSEEIVEAMGRYPATFP